MPSKTLLIFLTRLSRLWRSTLVQRDSRVRSQLVPVRIIRSACRPEHRRHRQHLYVTGTGVCAAGSSMMRASIVLADFAETDPGGKVHILGAGWSVIGPQPSPQAVAGFLQVPPNRPEGRSRSRSA